MKEEKVIEGNRLIAEFLGHKFQKSGNFKHPYIQINTNIIFDNELEYHSNWKELMPVVEKIVDISGFINIDDMEEKQYWVLNNLTSMRITAHIQWVWKAVVNYIKWYNENILFENEKNTI